MSREKVYTTSSIKAMLSCAGFKNNPRGSLAMTRGNMLHSMFELGVENYDKKGSEYRGEYRPYSFLDKIDLEELEDMATQYMRDHPEYFTKDWEREQEINCTMPCGYKISGIVDAMSIKSTSAILVDYKSGVSRANPSSILDMLQAIMYAYIIFKTKPSITDVRFTFLYIEGVDDYITRDFNINDLNKMEQLIEKLIFATQYTGLRVNSKCKYCNNKGTCVLLAKEAESLDSFGIKKVKAIKAACKAKEEEYKEEKLSEAKKSEDYQGFTKVMLYSVDKDKLSEAQLLDLLKDEVKLTKKKALYLEEQGIKVNKKASYRMKN